MNTKHLIQITFDISGIPQFLYRMQPKQLTRTPRASSARAFKTAEEAQNFINQHAAYFGGQWEIVTYTPTASK